MVQYFQCVNNRSKEILKRAQYGIRNVTVMSLCGLKRGIFLLAGCLLLTGCGREAEEVEILSPVGETVWESQSEEEPQEFLESTAVPEIWYVYVCGAVCHPGVYPVNPGERIFEVIQKAGGFSEDASQESLNQALQLSDGDMIRVLTKEEATESLLPAVISGGFKTSENQDGRVNLNTADRERLMTLTGIGATRADKILAYREAHGGFRSIEEIMQVNGIKDSVFEQIKDEIKVE